MRTFYVEVSAIILSWGELTKAFLTVVPVTSAFTFTFQLRSEFALIDMILGKTSAKECKKSTSG